MSSIFPVQELSVGDIRLLGENVLDAIHRERSFRPGQRIWRYRRRRTRRANRQSARLAA